LRRFCESGPETVANPRIPGASLIGQSSPQEKNLEVTDERDTIVAIAAAGIYL
jgi:hypothetical protein